MWDEARVSWDNLPLRLPPLLSIFLFKGAFCLFLIENKRALNFILFLIYATFVTQP